MIGYVTIGVNDFEGSKTFYDAALKALGGTRGFSNDRMQGYSAKGSQTMLAICKPYDGEAATAGNGTMVSLVAPSREVVDQVYKDALAAGASVVGVLGVCLSLFFGVFFFVPVG